MRVQLALNVRNLEESVAFYSRLFDVPPAKRRPGYANFVVADPPLKLVLFESAEASERLNHLGVEVERPEEVAAATERLKAAGLASAVEEESTCCYATQDKVWAVEPEGLRWEWYRVRSDSEHFGAPAPLGPDAGDGARPPSEPDPTCCG